MKICSRCSKAHDDSQWRCPQCGWQPEILNGHLAFAPSFSGGEGFEEHYFARLAQMESGHFWFEGRNELLLWAVEKFFPRMQSLLEIGCGTGFVLSALRRRFPEVRLAGSEVFSAGLQFAAERVPGGELFQMDARHIPFREEFDVIGAFDVLEHIDQDEEVLRQMYQAARPGGGIILTVPQHPGLWSASDDYAFHKRRYTRSELERKVRRAGFQTNFITSFVSLLLPVMWTSRLVSRLRNAPFNPEGEFRINGMINYGFLAAMRLERHLIQAVSLPAGGSLLLAAKRP
jgi:SAM-dependent methyltransferase